MADMDFGFKYVIMKLVTGARTIYIKIAPCNLRNHKLPARRCLKGTLIKKNELAGSGAVNFSSV